MIQLPQFLEIVRNYNKYASGVTTVDQLSSYTTGMLDTLSVLIADETAAVGMPSALKALTSSAMNYPAEVKAEAYKIIAEYDKGEMELEGVIADLTAILAPYSDHPDIAARQFLQAAQTMIG